MLQATSDLTPLFSPESVAVIGASRDVNKFGARPIRFMLAANYAGRIYPIHRKADEILGLKAYRDIRQVPGPVDMAIIAVPAPGVVAAVEACAEAGVRSAVIFGSGFAEVGGEGAAWQARLSEIAAETGIRLVGPNCMGMLDAHSFVVGTFSASFERGWPKPGGVSIISQSGAMGSQMLVLSRERGLGVRNMMTTGNECDVDLADCVAHGAQDPATKVITVYMEGCRRPDAFIAALDLARRNRKPVIVLKVGASEVGSAAAHSHTASLAGADEVFDAVFRQHGAYRARTIEEMQDVAAACATGHFPTGNRLGIVTISGGAGVLSSDKAAEVGLEVPELPAEAQRQLKELMPFAAVRNPVDTTAQMLNDVNLLRRNMEVILDHGECDAILVFLAGVGFAERIMAWLRELLPEMRAKYRDRLIVLSMLCPAEDRDFLDGHQYVNFEDPSRAVHAIAALVHFGGAFARPDPAAPPALPKSATQAPAGPLNEIEAMRVLADAGLPMAETRLAANANEAAAAAHEIGFPVVLKIVSPDIAHKSDIGGVRLGLADEHQVREAHGDILAAVGEAAPDAAIDGVLVAPMIADGIEIIIGSHRDPVFGPVVLFGLGGIFVEIVKQVSVRVAPIGVDEARRMIDEVPAAKALLAGVRGRPPADIEALAEALARLSVYAAAHADSIESIDVNPLLVRAKGSGVVAADALVVTRQG